MKYITARIADTQLGVAPHWGAWIEILLRVPVVLMPGSHPTGVRGLK